MKSTKLTKSLIKLSETANFDSFCSCDLYLTLGEVLDGGYLVDGYMLKNSKGGFNFYAI